MSWGAEAVLIAPRPDDEVSTESNQKTAQSTNTYL
jgi:hypothetical protein